MLTVNGRALGASGDIETIRFTTDGRNPYEISLQPGTYTLTETPAIPAMSPE